ncbi:hypothetical protein B0F90DRAFT_804513 [Multifurca ochricompacta]|uniref:Trafficking protein particle complex subunit 13 middle domain-containing protein n=1 Tax=Multifurca ochricompacta TaxID=376703 RepID=A0AAD4MAU7_9AGAM|nr:hypothetical protein B0F90DRAFT_804513 [Multifurca ochricompacta]
MWFERIIFEPAPGWHVQDANLLPDGQGSLFSGPMAMMQPQDIRQYVYIFNEIDPPVIPVQYSPGTIIPLGRLDISWRSSFGEPGRLLTSMLSRRIPLPPNQPPARPPQQQQPHQPVSALPLHLQRSVTVTGPPSQPPSRSSTPPNSAVPHRSASPFRNRPMSAPPRPQSPITLAVHNSPMVSAHPALAVDVDLVVRSIPRGALPIEKPFRVAYTLGIASSVCEGQQRILTLAVQHVQPPASLSHENAMPLSTTMTPTASRLPASAATTMTSSPASRTLFGLLDGPIIGSPRMAQPTGQEDSPISRQHIPPPQPMPAMRVATKSCAGRLAFSAHLLYSCHP